MAPDINWTPLAESLAGELILPEQAAYEWTRKPFIARFDDIEPAVVVMCATPQDVAEALSFARRHDLEIALRSGGHCFAGYSSTRGMLINVTPMNDITVDAGTAKVGAGTRIGAMTHALIDHGAVVPSGSCPSVGVGGTTLGGGIGILGRLFGLSCDHVTEAEVVLADGRTIVTDHERDPDLLWALRGAGGGNFGVVTSLTFRTHPAPRMTNFFYEWDFEDAAEVLKTWQRWAPAAPEEMTAGLGFTAMEDLAEPPIVELFGAMAGTESDTLKLLDDFVERIGRPPAKTQCQEMSYRETAFYQAGLLSAVNNEVLETPTGVIERQGCRFTKSEFFARPVPDEAIERLCAVFPVGRTPGEVRGLEIAPWGFGYARVDARASAFAHRDVSFSLKHAIMVPPNAADGTKQDAHRWITGSWETVHPWGTGRVYPNFPDPDLSDWGSAYYGENFARLRQIKAAYDPGNTFRFQQSIPVG
ncbi:FAD-binding oxidoreductase [Actinomadura terrae]|uniref:FAD-binding oxidoreductase n=1 Tax=Actinomadura terrae TaxID=604353 RepID=UPI001FA7A4F6|nr:FAD-binding oxidoreductase [Actinomadura terrae]